MPNNSDSQVKPSFDYLCNEHEDEINLSELFGILLAGKWLILVIALCVLGLGVAKVLIDLPVYQADGLLQIKENSKPMPGLESLTGFLDNDTPVMAEIELLKSRMILGKVIENLDRKSTRLNSSHVKISYAVLCLKKKKK